MSGRGCVVRSRRSNRSAKLEGHVVMIRCVPQVNDPFVAHREQVKADTFEAPACRRNRCPRAVLRSPVGHPRDHPTLRQLKELLDRRREVRKRLTPTRDRRGKDSGVYRLTVLLEARVEQSKQLGRVSFGPHRSPELPYYIARASHAGDPNARVLPRSLPRRLLSPTQVRFSP